MWLDGTECEQIIHTHTLVKKHVFGKTLGSPSNSDLPVEEGKQKLNLTVEIKDNLQSVGTAFRLVNLGIILAW